MKSSSVPHAFRSLLVSARASLYSHGSTSLSEAVKEPPKPLRPRASPPSHESFTPTTILQAFSTTEHETLILTPKPPYSLTPITPSFLPLFYGNHPLNRFLLFCLSQKYLYSSAHLVPRRVPFPSTVSIGLNSSKEKLLLNFQIKCPGFLWSAIISYAGQTEALFLLPPTAPPTCCLFL